MPLEQLVKDVCNYKQYYTQIGGFRPFGVAFVFAGWDQHHGFQLYQSDPSGNYSGWRATVIGQNNQAGKALLKTDFVENSTVQANSKLAVKILLKVRACLSVLMLSVFMCQSIPEYFPSPLCCVALENA